uniref:Uncharacterized protein n=1 Tax=Oryza brachyantha TaxID=4533 RepID=J3LU09_ORYBR
DVNAVGDGGVRRGQGVGGARGVGVDVPDGGGRRRARPQDGARRGLPRRLGDRWPRRRRRLRRRATVISSSSQLGGALLISGFLMDAVRQNAAKF